MVLKPAKRARCGYWAHLASGFDNKLVSLVSLWTLFVELHPLKWARVQAVRRISDQLTTKELDEQSVCLKFCCKLGKKFTETFQLQDAFFDVDGESVSSTKKKKNEWMSRLKFKVFLVMFFDWKSVVHYEVVPRGQMVNSCTRKL